MEVMKHVNFVKSRSVRFIFFGFLYLPNDVTIDDVISRVVYK